VGQYEGTAVDSVSTPPVESHELVTCIHVTAYESRVKYKVSATLTVTLARIYLRIE